MKKSYKILLPSILLAGGMLVLSCTASKESFNRLNSINEEIATVNAQIAAEKRHNQQLTEMIKENEKKLRDLETTRP